MQSWPNETWQKWKSGFTLIELLIVVAIIAILAAIAVPNFLEAQTRSKISRDMNDMRSIATALEAYAIDHNQYPPHGEILGDGTQIFPAMLGGLATIEYSPGFPLTTPLAYLTSMLVDPLSAEQPIVLLRGYGYIQTNIMKSILLGKGFTASANAIEPTFGGWRVYAAGPDRDKGRDAKTGILYDPTNGTVSDGDLVRSQRNPRENRSEDES